MTDADGSHFIFRINDNGVGPNLLHQVCLERGWRSYTDKGTSRRRWNLWWRTKGFPVFHCYRLDKEQFTNHIPNASFICRKDNLIRGLKCMRKIYGPSYDFIPDGFNLPLEYKKLLAKCKLEDEKSSNGDSGEISNKEIWICKPVGLSQGRGISLFQVCAFWKSGPQLVQQMSAYSISRPSTNMRLPKHTASRFRLCRANGFKNKNPSDLVYSSNAVVQKYVKNPFLIGGYKFDLRLYVLVPSFHPLTVYVYQEGLVRFSTEKFSLNNLKNRFAHLTNSSLNKFGPGYLETKERVGAGCKWSLQQLRCYLQQTVGSDWLLWQSISTMIVLTIASQLSKIPSTVNCFEFYGFDVLIDSVLKPWLIEVNLSPALSVDCSIDSQIKKPMIHDMFDLIGLPICNTGLRLYTPNGNDIPAHSKHCSKSTQPVIKAAIKWNEKRLRAKSRLRKKSWSQVQSNNEVEKCTNWGNGQNWNRSKARDGNWIRVFPLTKDNHNHVKFTRSVNSSHRTYSTDEIKSVVSSAVSFLKIAKEMNAAHPNLNADQLNALMAPYLQPDAKIWLPPL